MKVNHKLELLDQFDDAAFALMMDEYAEAEGERLRMEFEEATRAGLTPAKPDSLDEKCRKQIRREFGKQRRREYAARGKSLALRAAACILVALCISATLIMSVEAIRVPFWKFISEQYGSGFEIVFSKPQEVEGTEANEPTEVEDLLRDIIPWGYQLVAEYENENGRFDVEYKNDEGNMLRFMLNFCEATGTTIVFEDEYTRIISLAGRKASFSTIDNLMQMAWEVPELETEFVVVGDGISEDEFLIVCSMTVDLFQKLRIDQPAEVPNALRNKLPQEYKEMYEETVSGYLHLYYENSAGSKIFFDISEMSGVHWRNTYGGEILDRTVAGYEATYIKSDSPSMIWYDAEREILFTCGTVGLSEEDHLALCEYLAEYYKNVTLPAVSKVIWD